MEGLLGYLERQTLVAQKKLSQKMLENELLTGICSGKEKEPRKERAGLRRISVGKGTGLLATIPSKNKTKRQKNLETNKQ